jgi:SOS response regulatory protein OraA/RecX
MGSASPATVTALRERPGGTVVVELDGRSWRVLPVDAVVRAELAVGVPLERPTARRLARELRRARVLAQASRSLAAASRSRRALDERLARAGHPARAREEALGALERGGLLDDAELARRRAEVLARRGYGDAAIRADLERRLVSDEVAAAVLAGLPPELERAQRALAAARAPAPALLRRLARRGVSAETIEELARRVAHDA